MNSEELNIQFLEVKDSAYRYAVSLLHDTTEAEDVVQASTKGCGDGDCSSGVWGFGRW